MELKKPIKKLPPLLEEKVKKWPSLSKMQLVFILYTLKEFDGNRTHTARALGISRRNISDRILEAKDLGMYVPPSKKGVLK